MARLDHPNIVAIYDVGEHESRLFLTMKLIDGPDLASYLSDAGPMQWAEALRVMEQVSAALDYAHANDLIHRDLKPSNIILGSDRAILTDFGLARLASQHSMSLTMTGSLMGTPAYMAPEAWHGRKTGTAADIYSLACIFHEMITGQVLFTGDTPPVVMMAHFQPPNFPESWPPGVPDGLGEALGVALAQQVQERYGRATELVAALGRLVALAETDGGPATETALAATEASLPEPKAELHPSIALRLSVRPKTLEVGSEAKWTVTLRNDGDADLQFVTVRHGLTLLADPFDLSAGRGRRFSFATSYRSGGERSEEVIAAGIASDGTSVQRSTVATVHVRATRMLGPAKATASPSRSQKAKTTADSRPDAKTGLELLRIPAGQFLFGDEKRRIKLSEYWISKTPVTNAAYARFVLDSGYEAPSHWQGSTPPPHIADHPVVNVNWDDVTAYCKWAGRSLWLPTEEEWEKAARGTNGRVYPWGGRDPTPTLCNFGQWPGSAKIQTTPVGRFSPQGDSPYGCVDMAGNVWEWTDAWYDKLRTRRVRRGGAFNTKQQHLHAAFRGSIKLRSRSIYAGFRVVKRS